MSNYNLSDTCCIFDFIGGHSQLSNVEIDNFVEIFQKNDIQEATVGSHSSVDYSRRVSNVLWLTDEVLEENKCTDIYQKIENRVNQVNQMHFKFDLLTIEPLQLTEYTSQQKGFYNYHIDANSTTKNLTRKLSFVIQLSDPSEFEGGDFCVIDHDGKEFNVSKEEPELLKKGNIIAFPSFLPHKVTPVTSGTRYSLVGWCIGPRFK